MHKESFQNAAGKARSNYSSPDDEVSPIQSKRLQGFSEKELIPVMAKNRWRFEGLFILLLVPTAFFVFALQWTKAAGPQWTNNNFENSYPYLFNSLLILQGRPPVHIDHPGTTTQVFGALCLRVSERGSNEKIVDRALSQPEKAIRTIHRAMLFLLVLSLYGCGLWAYRATGSLMSGFLAQLPVFLFQIVGRYCVWYGSDLMVIVFGVVALAALCILIKERLTSRPSIAVVLVLAVACGLGIATKLTFFPIAILGFLLCRGFKDRMIYCVCMCLSIALGLVPIYSKLHYVFAWIVALASHTGHYGSGSVGFIDQHQFLSDVTVLLVSEPILPILSLGGAILSVLLYCCSGTPRPNLNKPDLLLITVALPFGQIIGFMLIAKHANVHYLIPLLLTVGLNLYFLWLVVLSAATPTRRRIFSLGFYVLLAAICVFSARRQLPVLEQIKDARIADTTAYHEAVKLGKNVLRVDYYRSSSPEFAEYFADSFAGHTFGAKLEKKYPEVMFFNIFGERFETFTKFIQPKEFLASHAEFLAFGNSNMDLAGPRGLMTEGGRYALSLELSEGGNRIYKLVRKP
jgi:hypothetical protein